MKKRGRPSRNIQIKRLRQSRCVSCGSIIKGNYEYYPTLCRTCAKKHLSRKRKR